MFKAIGSIIIAFSFVTLPACQRQSNIVQGYIEGYFTYISSNSEGFLQSLSVSRGTPVKTNQLLFVLESQPEGYQVEQAQEKLKQAQFDLRNLQKGQRSTIIKGIEEQMQQAQADLEFAQVTYLRNQRLVRVDAVSKEQYDQAKSNFDRANARLKELTANLNEAQLGARTDVVAAAEAAVNAAVTQAKIAVWYLVKKSMIAPADSTVFDTYYRNGELVPAGRPVVSLLIPGDVRLIFFVPEPLLGKIALGNQVTIRCDSFQQNYPAIITYISPQAEYTPPFIFSDRQREKFVYRVEAKFNITDAKLMHPGQPVDVIISNSGSSVIASAAKQSSITHQ